MCWIGLAPDDAMLKGMTGRICHRGPDGEGHAILPLGNGETVGLGHRRLSIIDLDAGAQPMATHDGRFTIVFNGEIYNYVELKSDHLSRRTTVPTGLVLVAHDCDGHEIHLRRAEDRIDASANGSGTCGPSWTLGQISRNRPKTIYPCASP